MPPEPLPPDVPLSREHLHRLADFSCAKPGKPETRWEEDVRLWATAGPTQGGAIDAVEVAGDSVWLYLNGAGEVAGIASLGLGVRLPGSDRPAQTLPYMGLHTRGRGSGIGMRVFEWLIGEAARRHREDGAPAELVLEADPENPARGQYAARGFQEIGVDEVDVRKWVIMSMSVGD